MGLLDEQFFMYGEDIDLSWRLVEGGWENHYFAGTSIIHYKGESTKKGSLNYVMVFYRAMLLFAAKHFEGSQARAFSWMIRTAIYGRAALAIVRRMLGRWGDLLVVLLLTALAMGGSMAAMQAWGGKSFVWPDAAKQVAALLGVQLAGTWALGGYRDRRDTTSVSRHVLAWLSASMATLVVYSLWPETWRLGRVVALALLAWHSVAHAWVTRRTFRRHGNPFHVRRLLVAGRDVEKLVELLRRNEGERTRQQVVALWSGEGCSTTLKFKACLGWERARCRGGHPNPSIGRGGVQRAGRASRRHRRGASHVGASWSGVPHCMDRCGRRDVQRGSIPGVVCGVSAWTSPP